MLVTSRDPTEKMLFLLRNVHFGSKHLFLLSMRKILSIDFTSQTSIRYNSVFSWHSHPNQFITTPLRSMLKNNSLNGVSRQARPKRRINGGVWPLFRLVQVLVKRGIAMMNPVRILVIKAVPRAGLNQTTGDTIILLTRPRMYKVKLNCLVICRDICMTNSHLKLRTRRFKSLCSSKSGTWGKMSLEPRGWWLPGRNIPDTGQVIGPRKRRHIVKITNPH